MGKIIGLGEINGEVSRAIGVMTPDFNLPRMYNGGVMSVAPVNYRLFEGHDTIDAGQWWFSHVGAVPIRAVTVRRVAAELKDAGRVRTGSVVLDEPNAVDVECVAIGASAIRGLHHSPGGWNVKRLPRELGLDDVREMPDGHVGLLTGNDEIIRTFPGAEILTNAAWSRFAYRILDLLSGREIRRLREAE